jgi:hypothetical protein
MVKCIRISLSTGWGGFRRPVALHSEMTLITAFVWHCHVDVNGRVEVNSVQEMSALEELGNLNNENIPFWVYIGSNRPTRELAPGGYYYGFYC